MPDTLSDLIPESAQQSGGTVALRYKNTSLDYETLLENVARFANGLMDLRLHRGDRVAIFAEKRPEIVIALFGASDAGCVFVPVNALLKPRQVTYILNDCGVRVLVTTTSRYHQLANDLESCPTLQHVILIDSEPEQAGASRWAVHDWQSISDSANHRGRRRVISSDIAAIMYTSGSTGMPKGVVLSHANMTIGAVSVATYLRNSSKDRILSALPLSFDAGLSQLTTGLYAGACVVLHDYLLARDIVRLIEREQITGLTGVPPMWIQLSEQKWPEGSTDSMRYFANTGGKMPRDILNRLREIFHRADPYLMYGLTESFRSTYLPPSEVDSRPDSIGKAIPNAEILVVNGDGQLCGPGETGELVHRGPLVSRGYWNDPEKTAAKFRPVPGQTTELPIPELAVWSGDIVRMDEDGFLYFVGRIDDMIKTSGYRVSPTEIEELTYGTDLVSEVAALGVPHNRLGQAIVLVAKPKKVGESPTEALLDAIRPQVPSYMVPLSVHWKESMPRNANGKLDRAAMATEYAGLFLQETSG